MDVADDLTYAIPTETDMHCNRCDAVNVGVTVWDDIRTGRWSFEFTCAHCGALNQEDGDALERGSVPVAASVFWAGIALMLVGWFALGGHPAPILTGLAACVTVLYFAAVRWLHENGID
jgi:hypothetical protein